ncbi:hypothetical protein [Solicola gregarius]|uniref:Uncharacterized protein n=1 Tax=Solicola gregarius TaxID=2908642 RepID=A0AA46TJ34_9ACTN|nr:hypothetical protein [Solicola gregarius]UYM06279.1 hypothetical protein L0C25_04160 [Solicola gregarius]
MSTDLTGYDTEDKPAEELLVLGGLGSCGPEEVERAFPPGHTRRACEVALTPAGRSLKELRYQPVTGAFAADPIVWSIARRP